MGRLRTKSMSRSALKHGRAVTFKVLVRRVGGHLVGGRRERGVRTGTHYGRGGFSACVTATSHNPMFRDFFYACAIGKNPRSAIGSAMIKAGADFRKRRGAFAGYRRK